MSADPDSLFFVIGTGRCGSTLLQAMLSCHPNLYIPPELRYFGRLDPAVRFSDPLQDAEVGPYLAQCARDIWWQDMGLDREAFEAAVRDDVRGAAAIYLWVLGHVAEQRGITKPRLGDKTPNYVMVADRIAALFPKARFIHLYRDPRDVAASYLGQYWSAGATALRCAGYVKYALRRAEALGRELGPERYCNVKYEDLVLEPERELRRLCRFLGETFDPGMLRHDEREDQGFLEVEAEWKGLTNQALTDSRIGRYARKLTPRQIWTVERLLGPMLGQYGYAPSGVGAGSPAWKAAFWGERIWRKALRTLGARPSLLDEAAVMARRNQLIGERREGAG